MSVNLFELLTSKEFIVTNIIVSCVVSIVANFLTQWLQRLGKKSILSALDVTESVTLVTGAAAMMIVAGITVLVDFRHDLGSGQLLAVKDFCWQVAGLFGGTGIVLLGILAPVRIRRKPDASRPVPSYFDWVMLAGITFLGAAMLVTTLFLGGLR